MRIYGIALKRAKRAPMHEVNWARITLQSGILGDCRGTGGSNGKRQVALLSLQQWGDACKELGADLPWRIRRAGICIDGITFGSDDVGKRLILGDRVILEITEEMNPCVRMDREYRGLTTALTSHWRGGVLCRVVKDGTIEVTDPVSYF